MKVRERGKMSKKSERIRNRSKCNQFNSNQNSNFFVSVIYGQKFSFNSRGDKCVNKIKIINKKRLDKKCQNKSLKSLKCKIYIEMHVYKKIRLKMNLMIL